MKRFGMKLDGDELYEEFQRTYDESDVKDVLNTNKSYLNSKISVEGNDCS